MNISTENTTSLTTTDIYNNINESFHYMFKNRSISDISIEYNNDNLTFDNYSSIEFIYYKDHDRLICADSSYSFDYNDFVFSVCSTDTTISYTILNYNKSITKSNVRTLYNCGASICSSSSLLMDENNADYLYLLKSLTSYNNRSLTMNNKSIIKFANCKQFIENSQIFGNIYLEDNAVFDIRNVTKNVLYVSPTSLTNNENISTDYSIYISKDATYIVDYTDISADSYIDISANVTYYNYNFLALNYNLSLRISNQFPTMQTINRTMNDILREINIKILNDNSKLDSIQKNISDVHDSITKVNSNIETYIVQQQLSFMKTTLSKQTDYNYSNLYQPLTVKDSYKMFNHNESFIILIIDGKNYIVNIDDNYNLYYIDNNNRIIYIENLMIDNYIMYYNNIEIQIDNNCVRMSNKNNNLNVDDTNVYYVYKLGTAKCCYLTTQPTNDIKRILKFDS